MTPEEERWTKIENALETVAEGQAQHTVEIAELRKLHKEGLEETADLRRMHSTHMVAISKLIDMQRDTQKEMDQTQKQIDQLTKNMDRFLKGQGSNGKGDQ